MLTISKFCAIAALFIQILTLRSDMISLLIIMIELIALINASSIKALQLLKNNFFIISFSLFFGLFAFISGTMANDLNTKNIILIIIKIVFTFNCIYSGIQWIGRRGLISIINGLPSKRIYLFIIFFIKTADSLIRTHNRILNQLKARLILNYSGKILIARYYIQNMIFKELYAINHHQAAYYTRISVVPKLYINNENAAIPDIIALSVIIAGTFAYFIL